ncbi:hypothetical protein [Pseudomonas fulva]|nr:hypothetical protein [Pseudomonas fulva]MBF8779294.1 hypothetical protein [Pseudomonas fulva]
MAIIVTKLTGERIPVELRRPGLSELFVITDAAGAVHYREDDVEAARLAVALSERSGDNE